MEAYNFVAGTFSNELYALEKIPFEHIYNGMFLKGNLLISDLEYSLLKFHKHGNIEKQVWQICQEYSELLKEGAAAMNGWGMISEKTANLAAIVGDCLQNLTEDQVAEGEISIASTFIDAYELYLTLGEDSYKNLGRSFAKMGDIACKLTHVDPTPTQDTTSIEFAELAISSFLF